VVTVGTGQDQEHLLKIMSKYHTDGKQSSDSNCNTVSSKSNMHKQVFNMVVCKVTRQDTQ